MGGHAMGGAQVWEQRLVLWSANVHDCGRLKAWMGRTRAVEVDTALSVCGAIGRLDRLWLTLRRYTGSTAPSQGWSSVQVMLNLWLPRPCLFVVLPRVC